MNPLRQLQSLGQSIWLDDIHRGLLTGGGFRRLIEEDGISGVTSNPAILRKAILDHDDYDAAIGQLAREGSDARAAYETLVLEDLRQAADLLQPVYAASGGRDGYVSMEVSPHLAYDTEATVIAARRLWGLLDRPNVMIKVPATPEGLPAIRSLISEGINVNATLLFSLARYREVAQAFIDGLQDRQRLGKPLDGVASVASFFMSRIDVLVDKLLDSVQDEALRPRALALRGKTAIASGKIAYQDYKALFAGPDWDALAGAGARSQRLLWAST
ncbi:MAG TPA: transaldolase, partial [Gammaproteobacteria bacterium]|nr:transaldolase [Gammaproteobacteria bacterium]